MGLMKEGFLRSFEASFPEMDGILDPLFPRHIKGSIYIKDEIKLFFAFLNDTEKIEQIIQQIKNGEMEKCPHWVVCECCCGCNLCLTPPFFFRNSCPICGECKRGKDLLRGKAPKSRWDKIREIIKKIFGG
jgi:hypothetical protein